MSVLTIGRVGLDVDLDHPFSWVESGDSVRVEGYTSFTTTANILMFRQQLLGYVDSADEDFVPVTWSVQPSVDGFYRVVSASVDAVSGLFEAGALSYQLELVKVQGFAAPLFEVPVLGALRVNTSSIATGTSVPWVGLPGQVSAYNPGALTPDRVGRTGEDGSVFIYSGASNFLYNAKPSFFLAPSNWYKNAATIKIDGQVVVGGQVANSFVDWSLSNGLVKLSSVSPGLMTVWGWVGGTGWVSLSSFRATYKSGIAASLFGSVVALTVLRNSPEEVVVRLTYDTNAYIVGSIYSVNVDLSLRRGSRYFTGRISTNGVEKWGVTVDSVASSAITGGRTFNVTASEGIVVSSPNTTSTYDDTFAFTTYLTSAGTSFDFMVGHIRNRTSPATVDGGQSLVYQYMAALNEKVTVVAR